MEILRGKSLCSEIKLCDDRVEIRISVSGFWFTRLCGFFLLLIYGIRD